MIRFADKLPRALDGKIRVSLRETQYTLWMKRDARLRELVPALETELHTYAAGARWVAVVRWRLLGVSGEWVVSRKEDKPADEQRNPRERFKTQQAAELAAQRFAARAANQWKAFYIEQYKLTRIGVGRNGSDTNDERIRPRIRTGAKSKRSNNPRGV